MCVAVWIVLGTMGARAADHIVQPGDTLSQIAEQKLGSMHMVPLMLVANPSVRNPNRISVGQRLVVPIPGFWAQPFLDANEQIESRDVLSHRSRTGDLYLGVHLRHPASDPNVYHDQRRYLAVRIPRTGVAEVVFRSTDYGWNHAWFRHYGGWNFAATDLDALCKILQKQ